MYYTLKQRPAFRHDSTEGPWVMRQTHTLGTQPDVHTSSADSGAADVGTLTSSIKNLCNTLSVNIKKTQIIRENQRHERL